MSQPALADVTLVEYFEKLYFGGSTHADADSMLAATRYLHPKWFNVVNPVPQGRVIDYYLDQIIPEVAAERNIDGVFFDDWSQSENWAPRIKARAVDTREMPFMNKTEMLDEERELLGLWIAGGLAD